MPLLIRLNFHSAGIWLPLKKYRPISFGAPDGKELNSLTWTLQTCIKVHNAIVALYNEMILKK